MVRQPILPVRETQQWCTCNTCYCARLGVPLPKMKIMNLRDLQQPRLFYLRRRIDPTGFVRYYELPYLRSTPIDPMTSPWDDIFDTQETDTQVSDTEDELFGTPTETQLSSEDERMSEPEAEVSNVYADFVLYQPPIEEKRKRCFKAALGRIATSVHAEAEYAKARLDYIATRELAMERKRKQCSIAALSRLAQLEPEPRRRRLSATRFGPTYRAFRSSVPMDLG